MNFFLTNNVGSQTSGIEHAQVKRLNLFLEHNTDAAIVSTFYYSRFHYDFHKNGLDDDHSINLFDFFLNTLNYKFQEFTLADFLKAEGLSEPKALGEEVTKNNYAVQGFLAKYPDGKQAMIRVDKDTNQLDSVAYATPEGKMLYSDVYDYRGFKSLKFEFDETGQYTKKSIYLKPDGTKVFQFLYSAPTKQKGSQVTRIILNHDQGMQMFMNVRGLETFFFDALNEAHGLNNVFISDRYEITPSLGDMKTKARKFVFIHSNYTVDPDKPDDPRLNYNYSYGIQRNSLFDGLIVGTELEKKHLVDRFHFKKPVYAIPSGQIAEGIQPVQISQRHKYEIMAVARISPEKRLDQIVRAFAKVHEQVPEAVLNIFGFVANREAAQILNKTVEENDVMGAVHFMGYEKDLSKYYDQGVAMAWTSAGEGFGLALVEAMSHGVPVVSYDINYGPNEIIEDNTNGYLIPNGDVDALADRLLKIVKDDILQQRLSENAYKAAQKYAPDQVWAKWQVLLDDPAGVK